MELFTKLFKMPRVIKMGLCQSMDLKNLVYYFIGFYIVLFLFSSPIPETTITKRDSSRSDKVLRMDWLKNEIKTLQDELHEIEDNLHMMEPSNMREWIRGEIRGQLQSRIRKKTTD